MHEQMAGSIYQKIAKAMSNINRIPKRGYNSFHKYEYVLEADLLDHIRPILLEAGLVLIPTILEEEKNGEFTKVKMEFTVADVETGETIKSTFWGEGQDKNDKGLYKAYTGATKYFLKGPQQLKRPFHKEAKQKLICLIIPHQEGSGWEQFNWMQKTGRTKLHGGGFPLFLLCM
ncbi:hypothetical protein FA954_13465 (plasmid) [Thermoactinomyces vulgaris]|jgi:hypothetical protein|nr:hypothetical protein FA954_13465 [Thermoactinomyces vulgaris]